MNPFDIYLAKKTYDRAVKYAYFDCWACDVYPSLSSLELNEESLFLVRHLTNFLKPFIHLTLDENYLFHEYG